jgi:hypothetical protein
LSADEPHDEGKDDVTAADRASYDVCLATWGAWLIEWRGGDEMDTVDVATRREDAFCHLVQSLLGSQRETSSHNYNKSLSG